MQRSWHLALDPLAYLSVDPAWIKIVFHCSLLMLLQYMIIYFAINIHILLEIIKIRIKRQRKIPMRYILENRDCCDTGVFLKHVMIHPWNIEDQKLPCLVTIKNGCIRNKTKPPINCCCDTIIRKYFSLIAIYVPQLGKGSPSILSTLWSVAVSCYHLSFRFI